MAARTNVPSANANGTFSHLLSFEAEPGRVFKLALLAAKGSVITFDAEGENGNVRALDILEQDRQPVENVNLLASEDEGAVIALRTDAPFASHGVQQSGEYRLTDGITYFLRSTNEGAEGCDIVAAEFLSPVTNEHMQLLSGSLCRLSILVASHRCSMNIEVRLESQDGNVLESYSFEQKSPKQGGATPEDFEHLELNFTAPAVAARMRILMEKSATQRGIHSYAFFARPSFVMAAAGRLSDEPIQLRRDLLSRATEHDMMILKAKLRLAEQPSSTRSFRPTIRISIDGEEMTIPCYMPVESMVASQVEMIVEHRRVRLKALLAPPRSGMLRVGLYVGGELDGIADVVVTDGRLSLSMEVEARHLDGMLHAIELRLLPEQRRIAFQYAILPFKITPWRALQEYAGSQTDIASSPAAVFHYRNLRAWIDALGAGRVSELPALAMLQNELLRGFATRKIYPPLAFPVIDRPQVSIVIPVHNKFEVTYYCLCALLFAYSHASFEVIIVDDGSSDATVDIEEIVTGVTLVRHETAAGFVASCNDGAERARGDYIAFLNNDTEVTVGWLDALIAAFEDFEDVGLVGARLLYPDGRLQEAGGIVWRSGNPWNVGRNGNANDPQFNYLRQVDYLSGAAIMLPRATWTAVGGFSPEFAPAYFEDTDLAMKVRDSGARVLYVPSSTVFHFEGQSAGTSTASGMKRFQEVNRPKFKRKWAHLYRSHGVEGVRPDREKDRNIAFRVLFIDQRFPSVNADAGSYAAFQEIRLLQSMGAKVTCLPRNLAWMDGQTTALQRAGVECLYAPFVLNFVEYIEQHAAEYDVVYVDRFRIAEQVVETVRRAAPKTKIVFNLVDLHFLRELREAAVGTPGYSFSGAEDTRVAELAMIRACDLTLTYSEIEQAVIESHIGALGKIARVPWVVEPSVAPRRAFAATRDFLFLGGFGHPPNIQAVSFFATQILPAVRQRLPEVRFRIIGNSPTPEVLALASESVLVDGFVADLDEAFAEARVFVVPLLAGAGIKGKVLEAMARGASMVISPVAAEATKLSHGNSCLIASRTEEWVASVCRLYEDEALWEMLGNNALQVARDEFSFERGGAMMRDALDAIDIYGAAGLTYRHTRPPSTGRE